MCGLPGGVEKKVCEDCCLRPGLLEALGQHALLGFSSQDRRFNFPALPDTPTKPILKASTKSRKTGQEEARARDDQERDPWEAGLSGPALDLRVSTTRDRVVTEVVSSPRP